MTLEKFIGMDIRQAMQDIAGRAETDEADEVMVAHVLTGILKVEATVTCGIAYIRGAEPASIQQAAKAILAATEGMGA